MRLTNKVKAQIDAMNYYGLLRQLRFGPRGDPMFRGESWRYFAKRMAEVETNIGKEEAATINEVIGWGTRDE